MLRLDRGEELPGKWDQRVLRRYVAAIYGGWAAVALAMSVPVVWALHWVEPARCFGIPAPPAWIADDLRWSAGCLAWLAMTVGVGVATSRVASLARAGRYGGLRPLRYEDNWLATVHRRGEHNEALLASLSPGSPGPLWFVYSVVYVMATGAAVIVGILLSLQTGRLPSEVTTLLVLAMLAAPVLSAAEGDPIGGLAFAGGVWGMAGVLFICQEPILGRLPLPGMVAVVVGLAMALVLGLLKRADCVLFTTERALAIRSRVPKKPWSWARLTEKSPSPPEPHVPVVATEWRRTDPILLTSLPAAALVVVGPPSKRWWMRVSDRDGQELAEYLAEKHWSFEDRRGSFPVRACRLLVNTALVLLILALAGVQSWFCGRLLGQSVVAAQVGLPALDLAERGDAEGFQQALGPVLDQRPNDPVLWALYATGAERLDLTSAPAAWMRVYTLVDGGGSLGRAAASRLGLPAAVSPP